MFWPVYLILINAFAFLLMRSDKRRAQKKKWRIRESGLLWSAALGGSLGALLGMYLYRHKTKHPQFTVGIPLILAVQLIIAAWLLIAIA